MRMLFLVVALCGSVFIAGSAQAAVKFETINYKQDDTALEGWLVYDDAIIGKRPGIVIFPAWWGPSAQDKDVAEGLAKMGYVAFVADIYGKGVRPDTIPAAAAESGKFYKDRPLVLARAQAAFDQLRQSPITDASKLAAIGYCFGGMPALDLARSGAPLVDVVVFHGSLGTPNPESDKNIKGHVLALHGAADPIVNAEAVGTFEKELTDAGVDWQVNLYGGVMHAFTDHVHVQAPDHGIKYDAAADQRSWQAMSDLFIGGQFTEVESGRKGERPELAKALALCKKHNATLVIARLDRLARNVHFISGLMETKVKFVACDMAEATPFMLHIYAAVAQEEARAISARTKAALAAAKQRGVRLGATGAQRAIRYKAEAMARAIELAPVLHDLKRQGLSLRGMAGELTKRQVPTPRGGAWHPQLVARVLERLEGVA